MRCTLAVAMLLSIAWAPDAKAAEPAADFYVAPAGNDSNPGTREKPFATPGRAQQAVRQRIAAGLTANVTVQLCAGAYTLAAPLEFGPDDSGSDQHAVTYAAAPGETVVLSGGRKVDPWQPGPEKLWTAKVPEAPSADWSPRLLWTGGGRAVRARTPNLNAEGKPDCVQLKAVEFDKEKKLPFALVFEPGVLRGLEGATELEAMVAGNWAINRKRIENVDAAADRVTLAPPHQHGPYYIFPSSGRWCSLENAASLLDQPGEWYLDRKAGTLRYWPRPEEKIDATEAVVPVLVQLVRVEGTADRPVRNLHFRGIAFEHTNWQLPTEGYMGIQACHYPGPHGPGRRWARIPAAVVFSDAVGCSVEDCTLAHLGGSGVELADGCRDCTLAGNHVFDCSANGMMVGGPNIEARVPRGNRVANNHVHACGREYYGAIGIWVGFAQGTQVAHNLVHDLPYSGISVGWEWNDRPTVCKENLVGRNHVYDVMNRLCDGGCIYTLGLQPGTVFRGNHLHDVHRGPMAQGAPNNGMFIDEGSRGFLFEQNVIYNTAAELVRFNQCQREWHTWRDNHFGPEAEVKQAGAEIIAEAGLEPAYRERLRASGQQN